MENLVIAFLVKLLKNYLDLPIKKFLLIKSSGLERYWVYFDDIIKVKPLLNEITEYYRNDTDRIKCRFKVIRFEKADSNVMSKCNVSSTGQVLFLASKYSMSSYFVIEGEYYEIKRSNRV